MYDLGTSKEIKKTAPPETSAEKRVWAAHLLTTRTDAGDGRNTKKASITSFKPSVTCLNISHAYLALLVKAKGVPLHSQSRKHFLFRKPTQLAVNKPNKREKTGSEH